MPSIAEKQDSHEEAFRGSVQLQEIVDSVGCYDEFLKLNLSVTIADPLQEDCPLIACSEGFTELTGYTVSEIVGRNCRFLLNGVPEEFIDDETRFKCRDYVNTTKGQAEELTDKHLSEYLKRRPWAQLAKGELICVQTNATKTGEYFKNMFYMKQVELNEKPFILGLQARLPEEWETSVDSEELERFCQQAFVRLGKNISAVELVLSKQFWYSAAARRQDGIKTILPSSTGPAMQFGIGFSVLRKYGPLGGLRGVPFARELVDEGDTSIVGDTFRRKATDMTTATATTMFDDDDFDIDCDFPASSSTSVSGVPARVGSKAPNALHKAFLQGGVQRFPEGRFELVRKIEDANRNFGCVCLMRDSAQGTLVAIKQMPNSWIQRSHDAFLLAHPHETEMPWNDIGCNAFLNSVGYPYGVKLIGVFRDKEITSVVTEFAAGGDLFSWASKLTEQPGQRREALVKPLAKQIAHSIQYLHDLSIVHGDLSIENILLSSATVSEKGPVIKLIDFGAVSTHQFLKGHITGKPSYQAPEIFDESRGFDGFLSDAFALGVVLYATCLMDYPWISTSGKGDKCFQYVKSKGFASFARKRKLPNSRTTVADVISPELCQLLSGLLEMDPSKRLTLGEAVYPSSRRSVWDEDWMR